MGCKKNHVSLFSKPHSVKPKLALTGVNESLLPMACLSIAFCPGSYKSPKADPCSAISLCGSLCLGTMVQCQQLVEQIMLAHPPVQFSMSLWWQVALLVTAALRPVSQAVVCDCGSQGPVSTDAHAATVSLRSRHSHGALNKGRVVLIPP